MVEEAMSERQQKVVLVVEPERELRDLAGDQLRQADYMVFTAATASEAREWLQELYPDLMLLSADLPGAEVLIREQRLRYGDARMNLPVVFLGSSDSMEELRQGYEQGALCHIFRSDAARRLPQLLESALERLELESDPN